MNLELRMFGDAICSVPGAQGKVALTFDDGPDPTTTRVVLGALRAAGAKATFFVVGQKAEKHPDVLREIVAEGHALGVHGYGHDRFYSLLAPEDVKSDIQRTQEIVFSAVGHRPVWFRPPVGQMSPRTALGVDRADAVVVGWNIRGLDGLSRATVDSVFDRVSRKLDAGAIVLLHDAWEGREVGPDEDPAVVAPAGVRALPKILQECERRGLSSVTIPDLMRELLRTEGD
jgi:peptidoglycan/xylan/chitin deacetylase (PgdA/CDA1 family)